IVIEHGLSSEITHSPGGSSDASNGSENSRSFKDSRRSDKEDSEDRASFEEGGSETPQSRRSTRESRASWKKAINEEMVSLKKNQTWSLVRLPAGKKALQSKWVFRGVDYNEIFSPVVKMTTIRLVLSIVAVENLHLEQLDVKTTFLHGDLDEDIYMTQPEGFQSAEKEENLISCLPVRVVSMFMSNPGRDISKLSSSCLSLLEREGTLSLKKIIGAKNPAVMLTKVVITEKLKLCAASTISEITDERRLRVPYVRRYMKVRAVALLKGRWFEVYRDYLRRRAVK
ncbi:retrovirus-related pol polyprotein from transposon TNT 1-94, partial [Tanacetum coccineum]